MSETVINDALPEFTMPPCMKHFFKGYRWWCRACSREIERQFEDVCVALWTLQNGRSEP